MQSFVQQLRLLRADPLVDRELGCIPIPSEITFVVAGALCTTAVTGHAQFTLWAVIVVGTLGSLVGSIIAYEIGRSAGRRNC